MKNKMDTWTIIGALVAVIALLFTITSFLINSIDNKIEEKISDPTFIQKIAKEVRLPFLIFDESGVVLSDVGANNLIDSIHVVKNDEGDISEIQISPKEYLSIAPILESFSKSVAFSEPVRAKTINWHYKVDSGSGFFLVTENYSEPIKKFRLTVIK